MQALLFKTERRLQKRRRDCNKRQQANHLPLLFVLFHVFRRHKVACNHDRLLLRRHGKENLRGNIVILKNHVRVGPHAVTVPPQAFLNQFFAASTPCEYSTGVTVSLL